MHCRVCNDDIQVVDVVILLAAELAELFAKKLAVKLAAELAAMLAKTQLSKLVGMLPDPDILIG